MRATVAFGILGIGVVLGCGGGGTAGLDNRYVGSEPPLASVGDEITAIVDSRMSDRIVISVDDVPAFVTEYKQNTIKFIVPEGTKTGNRRFNVVDGGVQVASFVVLIGEKRVVPEVEPNNVEVGNAPTNLGLHRSASGTLSTVSDKDYFNIDKVTPITYRVQITPKIVDSLLLDFKHVVLDEDGVGTFTPLGTSASLGVTGGVGDYTIKVEAQF